MKSVFRFRVRLGYPDLDFENLNPDFPIERTLCVTLLTTVQTKQQLFETKLLLQQGHVME